MDSTTCRDLCERWENDYIANKNILAFGEYNLHNSNSNFCFIMPNLFLWLKATVQQRIFKIILRNIYHLCWLLKNLLKTVVCHIQHWTVYFHLAWVMRSKTILNTILKKVIFQILSNMHLNFAIIWCIELNSNFTFIILCLLMVFW